jgi:hypothetical protein
MLIGKIGKFTILSPFNKLGAEIQGRIVELAYIKHEVSTGVDVESRVYSVVGASVIYPTDLNLDVLLVTIQKNNGSKVRIPDKYILGLYDDDLNYVNAYLTVKIGPLPVSFDFTAAKEAIGRGLTDTVGVAVAPRDISVSVSSNNSLMMSVADAAIEEGKRTSSLINNISDYGKNLGLIKDNTSLSNKVSGLEAALKKVSKYT